MTATVVPEIAAAGMPFRADRDGFCKIDRWDTGCAFLETDPFAT
jgi:hypothetical protein